MQIVTQSKESKSISIGDRIVTWFNHLEREPREIILAVLVGLLSGVGVYLLREGIYFVYLILIQFPVTFFQSLFSSILTVSQQNYLIIVVVLGSMTLGGVILGILNVVFPPEKGDHGIAQVINAVENNQGRLRYRYPIIGLIKSAITIGSGGAAGKEGPVVQIGGGSGSAVGRFFRVTPDERKTLIMAGVAGGISATFNAPIGGLMFSFELFRRGDRSPRLLPLLVSSMVGSIVGIFLIGNNPFLDFPISPDYSPSNFIYFVLMGFILGILSVVWILGFSTIARFIEELKIPKLIKPALGGLSVGLIYVLVLYFNILNFPVNQIQLPVWIDLPAGSVFPNYFGSAKDAMNNALKPDFIFLTSIALIIFIVALIGNALTLGSGNSGGQLAPTLLMGLMLGVVFVNIFNYFNSLGFYVFEINPGLLEVLAMAAFFAGTTRLPMTSIILTAEVVGDFKISIPLMFTVAAAWFISRLIIKDDLFSISLKHKGIISEIETPSDYLQDLAVGKIMTRNVMSVSPKDRVEHVLTLMEQTNHNGFPVVENDELVGIITTRDLVSAVHSGKNINDLNISSCAEMDNVISVIPECPVVTAIEIMNSRNINRLPVIESNESRKLIGIVTRADLNKASLMYGLTAKHSRFEDSLFDSDFLIQLKRNKENEQDP